ncbi:MAG: hypothetical protein E2O95_04180, partial [Acidobacteria bacterium]
MPDVAISAYDMWHDDSADRYYAVSKSPDGVPRGVELLPFPISAGGPGGGSSDWVGLTDTPGTVTPNWVVGGNPGGTALVFIDPATLGGGGGGDVSGPGSSTDNAIARWDGTSGTLLANSAVYVLDGGKIGIGTTTVPHAGVGNPTTVLAFDAPGGSNTGPHVQWTVANDDHPVMQMYVGGHGNVQLVFDAYNDGTDWIASGKHGARIWQQGSGNNTYHGLHFQTYNAKVQGNLIPDNHSHWKNRLKFFEDGPVQIWSGNSYLMLGGDGSDF